MRPMLAETVTEQNIHMVKLPVYESPKLDGYRAFKFGDQLMSRSFLPIENKAIQAMFRHIPHGWDGELIVGVMNDHGACFNRTSKVVRTRNAPADGVRFVVFDNFADPTKRFVDRLTSIPEAFRVPHTRCDTLDDVWRYEQSRVTSGYEGLILRNPNAEYKFGRSTMTDQGMLKMKRFQDYEGTVVGVEEMYHNKNEAKLDPQGYVDRGTKKEGMVPAGVMGTMLVDFDGQVLRVSQGFDHKMRTEYWHKPPIGELCTFKCPPGGKPRSEGGTGLRPPYVFKGLRHRSDT